MSSGQSGPARRQLLALGALGLTGCATAKANSLAPAQSSAASMSFAPRRPLARLDARPERIMDITVCSRPFRPAGPRLEAERIGGKLVVHNYGHGGSGWSLAWGSAEFAVRTALADGMKDVAVIGCGALGLTAAITAQRAGAQVVIYAKEQMHESRSARATGVWSPDSRIALASGAAPRFPEVWEAMCRRSYRTHLSYLGLPGSPLDWIDRYILGDGPPTPIVDPIGFAHYASRVSDLTPRAQPLGPGEHPFPTARARRVSLPLFNIQSMGRLLTSEFRQAGGRIVPREFHAPAELASLREPVVINCTGYGARALFKDETLVPIRGQIAWLVPEPEVDYGVIYKGVSMLSRRDGVVIQNTGADEGWGFNDPDETPNRAEAEAAVATIASLYARAPAKAA